MFHALPGIKCKIMSDDWGDHRSYNREVAQNLPLPSTLDGLGQGCQADFCKKSSETWGLSLRVGSSSQQKESKALPWIKVMVPSEDLGNPLPSELRESHRAPPLLAALKYMGIVDMMWHTSSYDATRKEGSWSDYELRSAVRRFPGFSRGHSEYANNWGDHIHYEWEHHRIHLLLSALGQRRQVRTNENIWEDPHIPHRACFRVVFSLV